MIHVYASASFPTAVEHVWAVLRDFNGLPQWHPMIRDSRIEEAQPADRVGCIRNFHTHDGGLIREKLLALSDHRHTMVYSILESGMGVTDYVATLRLHAVTDGNGCFVEWLAEFNCAAESEQALRQTIGHDVFCLGLRALGSRAAQIAA
jgi:hypothetical protein